MATTPRDRDMTLLSKVLGASDMTFDGPHETAWVEVIRKMDEVYSDLIRYEVDLEEKNSALAEAERFISSVLESVSDVLIVCDRDGRILQVNGALASLVGEPANDIADRKLTDYLMPLTEQDGAPDFAGCAPGTEMRDIEIRFRTTSGPSDLYAVNCSARLDQRRRRAGFVLTGRPVGELRRAYEALHKAHQELQQAQHQLVQQEKMASLGRLVAGVAHELNNPISFIYGNVHALEKYRERFTPYLEALHESGCAAGMSVLRRELRVDEMMDDLPQLIEGMNEGAARVSDIVKNLRRLSFAEPGEPQEVSLAPLLETAVRWAIKSDRKEVRIDIGPIGNASVRGHESQLHQVLVNLIQNALDAVREVGKPRIAIRTVQEAEGLAIEISDNGAGVDEDSRSKIFDPFFTTKPVGEGTGLGLWISYRTGLGLWISYSIVKEHGGTMEVEEAPGGGACFRVLFPSE
jgi:two-component system sensor histidine kinase HupT/HoxJ